MQESSTGGAKSLSPVSRFIGEVVHRDTRDPKMCDWCGKERATWLHHSRKTGQSVYLCFGCGDH